MIRSFTSGHPGCALLVCSLAALSAVPIHAAGAQGLYQPRPVRRAFAQGTRAPDGRPGPGYWQNRARYSMTLAVAPPNRTVTGSEQISYFNNSPDTLRSVVIRLIVNIHKPGAPRAGGAGDDYLTTGVHVDRFSVNGQARPWSDEGVFTVRAVNLPAPLLPHDSLRLEFDWHYDMSRRAGREGAIDSTTFFLAYAYPRVSVYDDYNGWDTTPFNDGRSSTAISTTTTSPSRCRPTSSCGARARWPIRPKCCSRRCSSAFRRRSHPISVIHVATARCPGQGGHSTAAGERLALHGSQRARHGLRPERSLRLGCRERRGRRCRAPSRERAGRLQRHRGRLSSHGSLRESRPRLALAQVAGCALSLREDDGGAGARRDGVPDDGQRRELSRHDVFAPGRRARDRSHLFPVLHGDQRDPLRVHG